MALGDVKPFPKAAQVPPRKPRRTDAGHKRKEEIRAKKCQCCRLCFTAENVDPHHIIPRSLGGLWTESNIVGLCRPHHDDVERRHPEVLAAFRAALTDSEYSYVCDKAGEGFLDRYYPVARVTEGAR